MVRFTGSALSTTNFSLEVIIEQGEAGRADARVLVGTDLNPVLRMMTDGPARRFLETLITEMEKFSFSGRRKEVVHLFKGKPALLS
jgi:hypothetical protein